MDDHPTSLSLIFLLFFLILISTIDDVAAQNLANRPSQDDSATSFQPSLGVIIGLLAIMFFLTFLLLLYAKLCHHSSSSSSTGLSLRRRIIQDGLLRSASGLDKTLVQSLPFFRFSSLKGSREGLECAVCLSRFDDIEVLRMLPKCKHAFHIGCIDHWLEKHSTCPLCRRRVEADDLSELQYSSSLRFLWEQTELMMMRDGDDEESNLELYVEREENDSNNTQRSSRFSIVGGSFRRVDNKGKTVLDYSDDDDDGRKMNNHFHKMNHKIVVPDIVMKNRWSDVSSSDIMVLNSEMINDVSNERFSDSRNYYEQKYSMESMVSIKEEMERKRVFESKIGEMINNQTVITSDSKREHGSKDLINGKEKRSMSEIIVHPRLVTQMRSSGDDSADQEEMVRSVWLPIARKTVRWFADREKSPPEFHV